MPRTCSPGNKKFAKMVDGKCVRFGDRNMTIKKNQPGRKKSFCARHKCSQKTVRATPGYQSCLKWNCAVGRRSSSGNRRSNLRGSKRRGSKRRGSKRRSSKRRGSKRRSPKRRSQRRRR